MSAVTCEKFVNGAVDEKRYAAFVAKTLRGYKRSRDKANAKGDAGAFAPLYYGWTDEQCAEATRFYCECYREQFRVLVPVASPVSP